MKLEMVKKHLADYARLFECAYIFVKEITGLVLALGSAECLIYTQDEFEKMRKTSGFPDQVYRQVHRI